MIDHLHVLTDKPSTVSDVLRVLKGITARRVIDYLKEKEDLSSLAKLQHAERDHNLSIFTMANREEYVADFQRGDVHAESELCSPESRTGGA